jgi:UDP:flavonoid glycosyltransferase YjiC (YdhE family)
MITVVFYISGHGFGHASRDIEVINRLVAREPGVRIVVRTTVPRWLFELSAHGSIELVPIETDTGVTQIDSLRIDEDETARRAAQFYGTFDARAGAEAAALRSLGASIVVGDIPPLAFAAAALARVPSAALGNFTWDWIYAAYPRFERLAPGVLEIISRSYTAASLALRLPFHGGFQPMAGVTRDIPLIARRSRHSRSAVRRALALDADRPVVLASFGGHGIALPFDEIANRHDFTDFTLIVTDRESPAGKPDGGRLRRLASATLVERGLRYEDLVAAADVVVSKPGYGIVSECIANGTALLYTSRDRFVEYDVFVAEMPRMLRCRFLPQTDLLEGRWGAGVEALGQQPAPPEHIAVDGCDVAVDALLRLVPPAAGARADRE